MSRVIGVKKSPLDAGRWILALDCGHTVVVASVTESPRGRPTRKVHACDECIAARAARMAKQ